VGSLPADAGEAGHGDDAGEGQAPTGPHDPAVGPHIALDTVHEDEQGDDGCCDDELDHQDAVDSLDEPSSHRLVVKATSRKVLRSRLSILPVSLGIGRRLLDHPREGLLLRLLGRVRRIALLLIELLLRICRRLNKSLLVITHGCFVFSELIDVSILKTNA